MAWKNLPLGNKAGRSGARVASAGTVAQASARYFPQQHALRPSALGATQTGQANRQPSASPVAFRFASPFSNLLGRAVTAAPNIAPTGNMPSAYGRGESINHTRKRMKQARKSSTAPVLPAAVRRWARG